MVLDAGIVAFTRIPILVSELEEVFSIRLSPSIVLSPSSSYILLPKAFSCKLASITSSYSSAQNILAFRIPIDLRIPYLKHLT